MKYYITGGLGVIGSLFAKEMLNNGHSVIILDAAEEKRNIWIADSLKNKYSNRIQIHMERMEKSSFDQIEQCDGILHAAAHTGIPHSIINPIDDWISNAEATRMLLEKLRTIEKKIPTVVLSSVKPYRIPEWKFKIVNNRYVWCDWQTGIDELISMEPDEPYAASKMAQSALCMAYARSYNLPVMVFRCSNLYGAAPSHGPRHGWLTWFCLSATINKKIEVQGSGLQVRDMLYSDDVNSAVLSAFNHIDVLKGNVYNIGGGFANSISVKEAAVFLQTQCPELEIVSASGRSHEDAIFIANYQKFNAATNWMPQISVKTGILNILEWVKENNKVVRELYDL